MIPVLFPHDATSFITHGIGDLMETIKCESIVNSEGEYELELQYPSDGQLIGSLTYNNIIVAKVNDHGNNQAFRIYGVDKAINGLVTVRAQHISYDLSCVVVQNYEATVCRLAMLGLKSHAIGSLASPFGFTTDIPDTERPQNQDHKFKMLEPKTLRSALLDGDDSIYGCWEGDLVFDNYTVKFLKPGGTDVDAGKDRGVLIEYGIDMIDMQEEQSISEMITGVYPYWKGREEAEENQGPQEEFFVYGDIQYASGTFTRHRVIPLNITEYFPNNKKAPTVAEINQKAQEWMAANKVGEPVINLTVSYAELGKDVRLYDAVTVRFVKIGIDYGAKVISYKYDVLKERCIEVEVGNVKPSIFFKLEDASRLKRGLIPPTRIANKSIDTEKIATGSIGAPQIASHGISSANIADNAVINRSIEDYAVNVDKIADSAITESKIDSGAVTESKIDTGAVTQDKIGSGAVTESKIDTGAVTSQKIGQGEVKSYNLGPLCVEEGNIKGGAVTTAKIGNFAVESTKIKDGAITNWTDQYGNKHSPVASGSIKAEHVGNGEIVSAKIGDAAITSIKLQDGSVVDWTDKYGGKHNPLGKAAVHSAHVGDGEINYVNVGQNAIHSINIKDGEVTGAEIYKGGTQSLKIDGQYFKELSINSAVIGNSAITSVKIQDGQVVKWVDQYGEHQPLGDDVVEYENIGYAEVDSLNLNDFSITSTKLDGSYWQDRRQLPDGTWVTVDPAVVEMKIGNQEVANIKLVKDTADTISAMWNFQQVVAVNVETSTLSASNGVFTGLTVDGTLSVSTLKIGGRIVSTTDIDKDTSYSDVLYLAGYY